MPNWCTNRFTITSDDEKNLKPIKDDIKKIKEDGFLQTYIPQPEELLHTTAPSRIVTEEEYQKQLAVRTKWDNTPEEEREPNFRPSLYVTQSISDSLKKKYGSDNWYDWRYKHWGTKWNESEFEIDCYDQSIEGGFESPWCTPATGYKHISTIFKDTIITLGYNEMGMDYCGVAKFNNGRCLFDLCLEDWRQRTIDCYDLDLGDPEDDDYDWDLEYEHMNDFFEIVMSYNENFDKMVKTLKEKK